MELWLSSLPVGKARLAGNGRVLAKRRNADHGQAAKPRRAGWRWLNVPADYGIRSVVPTMMRSPLRSLALRSLLTLTWC